MKITVTLTAVDRTYIRRTFRTLSGAQRFAQKFVGPTPTLSLNFQYAISDDGVCKVTSNVPISDLFPASAEE